MSKPKAPKKQPTAVPDPTKWWDTLLPEKEIYDAFITNLGDVNAPSRVAAREWAMKQGFKSVLDVGCGPAIDRWEGTHIAWAGCDASVLLCKQSEERGDYRVIHASAERTPFADGAFDLVYSRHLWEHLPHYAGALTEACRVARKAVAIVFFRPPKDREKVQVLWQAHYNDYDLAKIYAAFNVAWPGCAIDVMSVMSPKYERVGGELLLLVTRAPPVISL